MANFWQKLMSDDERDHHIKNIWENAAIWTQCMSQMRFNILPRMMMHTWHIVLQHIHKQIARHLNNWTGTGHRPQADNNNDINSKASVGCLLPSFVLRPWTLEIRNRQQGRYGCVWVVCDKNKGNNGTYIDLSAQRNNYVLFGTAVFFFIPSPFHFRGFESWHIDMSAAVRHDNATNRLALDKHIAKKKRHGRGQSWWRHHSYGLHARKTKCISTAIYIEDFTIFDFTFTSIFYIRNLLCQLSLTE